MSGGHKGGCTLNQQGQSHNGVRHYSHGSYFSLSDSLFYEASLGLFAFGRGTRENEKNPTVNMRERILSSKYLS